MVIDSSALIAYLKQESGFEIIRDIFMKRSLLISSINRTEVKGRLVGSGVFSAGQVDREFVNLRSLLEVIPFDLEQSDLAAYYYARRNAYQLSLGDCACLALAEARGVEVLTAERAWAQLPGLTVKVKLIRS